MSPSSAAAPLTVAVVATEPVVHGPVGDLFRLVRALYLGTGVATSSWFLVDGAGRADWHRFTDRCTVLSDLGDAPAARLAGRVGGRRAAAKVRGARLSNRLAALPRGGLDVAVLDEGVTAGILDRLAPRTTVVRWTGRDTGDAERVERADIVLVAPDATRLDEAPAGPHETFEVGPVGDDARVAAHPVHRAARRRELDVSDDELFVLGTGNDVDAVAAAVASAEVPCRLGWIDDPAHFQVTESLVTDGAGQVDGVFAAGDLATLCAADALVARDLATVDPHLRALGRLSGVALVEADQVTHLLGRHDDWAQPARTARIREAERTVDALAAAARFRELVHSVTPRHEVLR